jgi:hypothetical protein
MIEDRPDQSRRDRGDEIIRYRPRRLFAPALI